MRRFPVALLSVLLSSCAHFWHPPPDVPQPLPARDWRRELTGTWRVVATRDSVPVPGLPLPGLVANDEAVLQISDSAASPFRKTLLARVARTAGDTASSTLVEVAVTREHGRRRIRFWPGISDNYFGLIGTRTGDCFHGTWERESWGRVIGAGRFVMCPMEVP